MIPKQDNSGNEFQNMINDMRRQFSSGNSIGDMKDSFNKSSGAIVDEIDVLIGVEQKNAKNMVNTMSDGFDDAMINLGKFGTHKIVDLNKNMLSQGNVHSKLLHQIRSGFGGRTGMIGTLKSMVLSLKPFSAERQAKIRRKQLVALNKIVRLSWMEQMKTNRILIEANSGSKEEEQEKMRLWERIWGRSANRFGRKDKADLKGEGRWGMMKKMFPLLAMILIGGASVGIAMIVENLSRFMNTAKMFEGLTKWFKKLPETKLFRTIVFGLFDAFKGIGAKLKSGFALAEKTFPRWKKFFDFVKLVFTKTKLVFTNAWASITWIGKKAKPGFVLLKNIFVKVGKVMGFFAKHGNSILKRLPFLGKLFKGFAKFVPFLNIVMAAWEVIRGAMKGVEEIGGMKGAITGMIGGVLEFFTFGLFDMGKFLETAKAAFAKFKDGDWIGGILGLIKAPIDGLSSGIAFLAEWLMDKIGFGGNSGVKSDSLFGKIMYWSLLPLNLLIKSIKWIADKIIFIIDEVKAMFQAHVAGNGIISRIKTFFVTLGEIFGDIINHPIKTIRAMINGTYKSPAGERTEASRQVQAGKQGGSTGMRESRVSTLVNGGMNVADAQKQVNKEMIAENETRRTQIQAEHAALARQSQMSPTQQQGAGNPRPTLILNDASFRAAEYHMNKVYNPHHD